MKQIANTYKYDHTAKRWYITIQNPRWDRERAFFVDDQDIHEVKLHKWSLRHTDNKWIPVCICHNVACGRIILKAKEGDIVAYVSQQTQDNTRGNLRFSNHKGVVTKSVTRQKKYDIPVKGVEFKKGGWEVRIKSERQWRYVGRFDNLYDAICCRIRQEYLVFGEHTQNHRGLLKTIPRYYLIKWLPEIYSNLAHEFIGSDIYRAHYKNKEANIKHVNAMQKAGAEAYKKDKVSVQ